MFHQNVNLELFNILELPKQDINHDLPNHLCDKYVNLEYPNHLFHQLINQQLPKYMFH